MLQILYSSGGLFATKMDLKTPFEIRIVTKISTFYGMYRHFPHKFTHFFVVRDVFALFDIFSEKAQHNFIKTRGGGGGGQWPFIKFIKKKQTFWYRWASLIAYDATSIEKQYALSGKICHIKFYYILFPRKSLGLLIPTV